MALTEKTYTVVVCDVDDCNEFYVPRDDAEPPKRWKKISVSVDDDEELATTATYNACTLAHANQLAQLHITIE